MPHDACKSNHQYNPSLSSPIDEKLTCPTKQSIVTIALAVDCFASLAMTVEEDGLRHDSRISNNRRPSFFSSFFTALEAAISSWLA